MVGSLGCVEASFINHTMKVQFFLDQRKLLFERSNRLLKRCSVLWSPDVDRVSTFIIRIRGRPIGGQLGPDLSLI